MRIDAHQHFWQYDPVRDTWISEEMQAIRRDFLPTDLEPLLEQSQMDGCVAVEAAPSDAQTDFLLGLAREHKFIRGVVGWVDLQSEGLEARLEKYRDQPLLKGFRHGLQGEPVEFILRPGFVRGVQALRRHDYTYDLLIFPHHLPNTVELVRRCDDQPFVLDHLAKPYIKAGKLSQWKKDLEALSAFPNVLCKVSGLVTEAEWDTWTYEQLVPYLDVAFEAFGTERLMFGSDWPVCLVAAGYAKVKQVIERYLQPFSTAERDAVLGLNAVRFYNLH